MVVNTTEPGDGLLRRWLLATSSGWLLGFALVIVLAMIWDLVGGGAQFMVGVGMGAGVGFTQGRVLKEWLERPGRWMAASVFGMGVPFVVADVSSMLDLGLPFSAPAYVVLGGLLAGLLQAVLLAAVWRRAYWWLAASAVGWSIPASLILLSDSGLVTGLVGGVVILAGILFGGVPLGAVTGGALVWLRNRAAV